MDDLQHNGLVLFQDTDYARFNADALLLLGFLRLTKRDTAVELGSGTGVICVLGADVFGCSFTGVEPQQHLVELSQKSARHNRQAIQFVCQTAAGAPDALGRGRFTAAVMNPPYYSEGDRSGNPSVALSRHAASGVLEEFLTAAFALLDNGGKLFLICPASALCDLFVSLRAHRLEPKRLQFASARAGESAARVLVEAKKLGKPGLTVEPSTLFQTQPGDTLPKAKQ
ncbi:MAG TPA: methyltransferase [Candidatus Cryosericum sp.]|nr:methyltransferase [Candidatus Cryosericum sp.]